MVAKIDTMMTSSEIRKELATLPARRLRKPSRKAPWPG